jgi:CubicO group peptidase (beta-lactamase class C family)
MRLIISLFLVIGLVNAQPAPDFAAKADALLAASKFRGSVSVIHDGKPVFRKGYGLANSEWDIPNAPDTKFRIGSITKQFTAIAILQLAEKEKLRIDDPVSKYHTTPAAWDKISIEHLLNHTSGIVSYTGLPNFFRDKARDPLSPAAIVDLTRDMPLEFEPGSKYKYNNSGYVFLGHIIERVSGMKYDAYVKQHILDPAGMADTGYDWSASIIPKRASGYNSDGKNAPYLDMSLPHAAGSLYSTVDDFIKWDRVLYTNKLITPQSWTRMTTPGKSNYGYGLIIDKLNGHARQMHGGGIHGFSTFFARFPDDRVAVVVFSNGSPTGKLGEALSRLYFGEDIRAPKVD